MRNEEYLADIDFDGWSNRETKLFNVWVSNTLILNVEVQSIIQRYFLKDDPENEDAMVLICYKITKLFERALKDFPEMAKDLPDFDKVELEEFVQEFIFATT
jgi:hypothetical protein